MKTNTLHSSRKFLRPAGLLALLLLANVPALASNSVSQDQELDQKLGILGGNWNLPTPPPVGGGVAPTQIKSPLPPILQQPVPPPPMPTRPPPR